MNEDQNNLDEFERVGLYLTEAQKDYYRYVGITPQMIIQAMVVDLEPLKSLGIFIEKQEVAFKNLHRKKTNRVGTK
ncbi:hypothetical protein [Clostridium magnum]|uniref:Uncharacterized protein n=1 Tax=Clostridium magnum DSM 2767 TaxID=1121326 RepID=A0A161Y5M0_9CLOT|nr:hypothetical protein [Clostridium magnum]KZL93539.1 hypothetical protein CLMAG_05850 [Clostridium magnum DSM 2767]SHI61533.1 hypothetical protein SAMN02745944_04591 [Clostridium magnum DSM 2767]